RPAAAALGRGTAARVLDQDPAHDPAGDRQEMTAIAEARAVLPGELEEGLVDDGGRLQRVAGALAAHGAAGDAPQLRVELAEEPLERGGVAGAPGVEQRGDLSGFEGKLVHVARPREHPATAP